VTRLDFPGLAFAASPILSTWSTGKLTELRKNSQIVVGFVAVGFGLPWLLLAFYAIAHRMGGHPSTVPLLFLCPFSIAAIGLEHASLIGGLIGWLVISAMNAALYAVPGFVISGLVSLGKTD
jgi:hypothetical protein